MLPSANSFLDLYVWHFMRIFTFWMAIMLGSNLPACSQESTSDFCSICKDHTHAENPPYRLNFKNEIPFIVSSGLILGTGFLAAELNDTKPYTVQELGNLNIMSINALDRKAVENYSPQDATTSDFIRTGVTILPILLLSEHHTKQDITALLAMSAEVMAITFGVTNTVKNAVNRARPLVYNPEVPLDERTGKRSRRSFFSGHTSHTAAAAFFMAKVITNYHPNMNNGTKVALWAVSSSIPAITAYLRVTAGKHFPTDVMAGYAVGAFTGWLIPHLHKVKDKDRNLSKLDLNVYPSNYGMQFSLRIGL
ncbi:MAG TPA: phosphatase PAP2 family protein [Cyclobacteriaceae bacterium]